MGLDKKTAESDSEGIEHHVSDRTLKKMKNLIKQKNFNLALIPKRIIVMNNTEGQKET